MSEEKAEKQGIKETLELLDSCKLLLEAGAKIAKDKKVGLDDLVHLVSLFKDSEQLIAGFTGLSSLDDELKDLDEQEAIRVLGKVWEVARHAQAAYK